MVAAGAKLNATNEIGSGRHHPTICRGLSQKPKKKCQEAFPIESRTTYWHLGRDGASAKWDDRIDRPRRGDAH
jgi:hypothetical protein